MGQVMESFGGIIFHGEISEGPTCDEGQGDGDLRDARLVQGVLDQFTDEPPLALLLGLATQPRLVNVEPLIAHGDLPLVEVYGDCDGEVRLTVDFYG